MVAISAIRSGNTSDVDFSVLSVLQDRHKVLAIGTLSNHDILVQLRDPRNRNRRSGISAKEASLVPARPGGRNSVYVVYEWGKTVYEE